MTEEQGELKLVRYAVSEKSIATITMDDPDSRNALSEQMLDDLRAATDNETSYRAICEADRRVSRE